MSEEKIRPELHQGDEPKDVERRGTELRAEHLRATEKLLNAAANGWQSKGVDPIVNPESRHVQVPLWGVSEELKEQIHEVMNGDLKLNESLRMGDVVYYSLTPVRGSEDLPVMVLTFDIPNNLKSAKFVEFNEHYKDGVGKALVAMQQVIALAEDRAVAFTKLPENERPPYIKKLMQDAESGKESHDSLRGSRHAAIKITDDKAV